MTGLQGIFLDFYGTLASGDRHAVESICQSVIDDHGLGVRAFELASTWGDHYFRAIEGIDGGPFRLLVEIERDTLIDTLEPFLGRIDVSKYIDQFNAYLTRPSLFEESQEVLRTVRLPVCIVSNIDERELRAALNHHQLPVAHVVTSESARSYKPEPRIFQHALELTGWSADHVLHVGDSLHSDVGGAHRAGIKAAWVNRADRIKDIGTEKPDFAWQDLRPLLGFE